MTERSSFILHRSSLFLALLAVLASALPDAVKVALIRLSMFGDWKTGANVWPSYETLGTAIGRSRKQAWYLLQRAAHLGWLQIVVRRLPGLW